MHCMHCTSDAFCSDEHHMLILSASWSRDLSLSGNLSGNGSVAWFYSNVGDHVACAISVSNHVYLVDRKRAFGLPVGTNNF
jgi:hypothetical protein